MLRDIPKVIKNGGKLVLITFHSLEDRIVKKMLFDMHNQYFESDYGKKKIMLDSKKVTKPSRDEILKNNLPEISIRLIEILKIDGFLINFHSNH